MPRSVVFSPARESTEGFIFGALFSGELPSASASLRPTLLPWRLNHQNVTARASSIRPSIRLAIIITAAPSACVNLPSSQRYTLSRKT